MKGFSWLLSSKFPLQIRPVKRKIGSNERISSEILPFSLRSLSCINFINCFAPAIYLPSYFHMLTDSLTIAEMGYVYNMLETDKTPNSIAVLYTPYLRAREQCIQMYYLIHGDQTTLTVNIIEERSRKHQEVWLVWVQKITTNVCDCRCDECIFQILNMY